MCGILGFIGNNLKQIGSFERILENLKTRGPDGSGSWKNTDGRVLLGHTRLAVLDLSKNGYQPMLSSSSRFAITFNGEIYNFNEIKKKINQNKKIPIKWRGHSDTEVLCESLEEFGIEKTLNMCDGMFAFAAYDQKNNELTLARDQFGEKPLYYGWVKNIFFFSSDLSILKSMDSPGMEIRRESVNLLAKYCYIPAPYTIYKNVFKLEPSSYIKINAGNSLVFENDFFKKSKSWFENDKEMDHSANQLSFHDVSNEIEKLIENSVKSRMVSDIPIGSFLSGGIDSSLITSLMQKNSSKKIETFSIGQDDKRFDELKYAREVSRHLNTNHNEFVVSKNDIINTIDKIKNVYSEPFADSSQIPSILLSGHVKKKVSVALTGDAGDELFGGYNRYIYTKSNLKLFKYSPFILRKFISKIGKKITPSSYQKFFFIFKSILSLSSNYGDKAHKIFDKLENIKNENDIYMSLISEWSADSEIFTNFDNSDDLIQSHHNRVGNKNGIVEKMMDSDMKYYLPDDILCKVDRAAMHYGLETRVPFLNKNIHSFMSNIPMNYKIKGGKGKLILRNILNKFIPRELIDRPKMGFSIPLDSYMRGPLKDWCNDLVNASNLYNEFFDKKTLIKYWNEHCSKERNWQTKLWPILMFISWNKNR